MNRHILVVEDQEDNRQILRDLLGSVGYELTEAENGEEAIAAVAARRPDLILMDIQLPRPLARPSIFRVYSHANAPIRAGATLIGTNPLPLRAAARGVPLIRSEEIQDGGESPLVRRGIC
jgi:CheY-like chemotaxis protein